MRAQHALGLMAALTLLGAGSAQAAGYSILPIVKFGDMAGTRPIQTGLDGAFEVGALNDNCQSSLAAENAAGGGVPLPSSHSVLHPILPRCGPGSRGQRLP